MWGFSSNYPSVSSYSDAMMLYSRTKPLRGKPNFRPLDARSSRAKSDIRKVGEDYIIRLYATDIIRYKPDGSVILNHGGWATVSTAGAISAMSPFTAWMSKGYLVVTRAANRWYSSGHEKFVVPDGGLEFDPQRNPRNPPAAVKRKVLVNREKAKMVRAYFRQVPKMIEAYAIAFKGGTVESPSHRRVGIDDMSDAPLSEEVASEIAMAYIGCQYNWRSSTHEYTGRAEVSRFWKQAYDAFGVYETHEIKLPYGVVP